MQDTLWSALDDRQLLGRIYRFPQPKRVIVYRLIAKKTSDVFLNNIAFDKAAMHEAFTGANDSVSKCNPIREKFTETYLNPTENMFTPVIKDDVEEEEEDEEFDDSAQKALDDHREMIEGLEEPSIEPQEQTSAKPAQDMWVPPFTQRPQTSSPFDLASSHDPRSARPTFIQSPGPRPRPARRPSSMSPPPSPPPDFDSSAFHVEHVADMDAEDNYHSEEAEEAREVQKLDSDSLDLSRPTPSDSEIDMDLTSDLPPSPQPSPSQSKFGSPSPSPTTFDESDDDGDRPANLVKTPPKQKGDKRLRGSSDASTQKSPGSKPAPAKVARGGARAGRTGGGMSSVVASASGSGPPPRGMDGLPELPSRSRKQTKSGQETKKYKGKNRA